MTLPNPNEPLEDYKDFKKRTFENTKNRISGIIENIKHTSLNEKDKKQLIKEVKRMIRKEF